MTKRELIEMLNEYPDWYSVEVELNSGTLKPYLGHDDECIPYYDNDISDARFPIGSEIKKRQSVIFLQTDY